MFSDQHLLPARRLLATALSVAVLGVVSPAWAQQSNDDDATGNSDKKEVRVYRMGDDDLDQGNWKDQDDNDNDNNPGDRDNDSSDRDEGNDQTKTLRYKVERADSKGGYLGVQVQDITRSLMKARDLQSDEGALVNRVENDSPADKAGIERGDVIVEANRQSIKDSQDLIETMRDIKPGSRIDVTVVRDGARKTIKVEVAKRMHDMMMSGPGFMWQGNGSGMDREQMRELRAKLREMDPERMNQMRQMLPGPELRQQIDELRKEVDSLKDELRDLKQQIRDSRGNSRGGRSDR